MVSIGCRLGCGLLLSLHPTLTLQRHVLNREDKSAVPRLRLEQPKATGEWAEGDRKWYTARKAFAKAKGFLRWKRYIGTR